MDGLAAETKGLIRDVLNSSKLQLTVKKLNYEYRELVGGNIPYLKLGFQSLEQYLHSLPDVLQICGRGEHAEVRAFVSDKSAHIRELIHKQRDPKAKRNTDASIGRGNKRPLLKHTGYEQMKPFYNTNFAYPIIGTLHPSYQQTYFNTQYGLIHNHLYSPMLQHIQKQYLCDVLHKPIPNIPHRKLMSETVCKPTNFNTSSKTGTQKDIGTPSNSVSTLNPTSRQNVDNNKNTIKEVDVRSKQHSASIFKIEVFSNGDEEMNRKVPQIVQENLRKLIAKYPDGIWCARIPDLYKKAFGAELDYTEYGYTSLIQMCVDLANAFNCIRPGQGDYKLLPKKQPLPNDLSNTLKNSESFKTESITQETANSVLPDTDVQKLMMNLHNVNIPVDIVKFGECIKRQWLNPDEGVDDYLDVNIAEIYDPSKFWLNLTRNVRQLNSLMDDIQHFYKSNLKKYEVPHFAMKPGLYIAVTFLGEYHRALIIDMMSNEQDLLKVYFVDYGTVSMVKSAGVCYLHKQFADFPAQGIRARLAGIQPAIQNEGWTKQAATKFLDLVDNKGLVAQIISIDPDKEILEVILANTDDEDFFINDALVYEELAEFSNQANRLNCDSENAHNGTKTSSMSSQSTLTTASSLKPKQILAMLRQRKK